MEIRLSAAPLPERLRVATRELHAASERSGVMHQLLQGRLGRDGFVDLLRNLHAIYAALESVLQAQRDHPLFGGLVAPVLFREAALAGDLARLAGAGWPERLPLAPATAAYVERLQQLGASASPALVAHAYVRYLGDLHGGQILARRVASQLALPEGQALDFYDFGSDEQVLALREGFRRALGALQTSEAQAEQIVAEALWAFRQHIRLFDELRPKTS